MPYPLSSDVSPGQPTAADHYNFLRSDALRFGHPSTDAVDLGSLLARFESNLKLVCIASDRIRLPASASSPVSLVIDGVPVRAVSDVDLAPAAVPSGIPADYYVFAVVASGSSSFSLLVDTEPLEFENARRIGRFYWDGSQIIPGSLRTEFHEYLVNQISYATPQSCNGRLTLSSGVPVTTGDLTNGTLYFTPYLGNLISLYAPGFGWTLYPFSELSVSFTGEPAYTNFDIFISDVGGFLTLEKQAWASDTSRNLALIWQDGYPVQYAAPHKRYLGTVRTSDANVLTDTVTKRFVWNMYNRVLRSFYFSEVINHTYAGTEWRMYNNDPLYRLQFVVGIDHPVFCGFNVFISNKGMVAVGVDSTVLATYAYLYASNDCVDKIKLSSSMAAFYHIPGYHFLQVLELSLGGNPSYFGDIAITGFVEG